MRSLLIILLIGIFYTSSIAQKHFMKEYDFGLGEDGKDFFEKVAVDHDTIYATVNNVCGEYPCTQLVKMNVNGDILNSVLLDGINLNRLEGVKWIDNSLVIADGKGSCCGEVGGYSLLFIDRNLNIIEENFYEVDDMNWCAEASLVLFENYYVIQGWGEPTSDPDKQPPMMIWVNKSSLELDTVLTFPMYDPKGSWDEGIVSDGHYYAYFNVSRPTQQANGDRARGFYVFDENINVIDSFIDESNSTSLVIRNSFTQLTNGNFVLQRAGDFAGDNSKYELRCITKNGQEQWKINSVLENDYFLEEYYNILATSDGNLIMYGWREWLYEFEGDPQVFNEYDRFSTGFMLKVNGWSGDVMWERIMVDFDEHENVKETYIIDLIELSDGSLMGFGLYNEQDADGDDIESDSWMFRASENGCIQDVDCDFSSFISSYEDQVLNQEVSMLDIFPNPTTGPIFINLPKDHRAGQLVILDNQGQVVQTQDVDQLLEHYRLDLSHFPSGVYYVEYLPRDNKERRIYTSKVVVKE